MDEAKRIKDLIVKSERYWSSRHRAMTERIRFLLDGKHYEDDDGDLSKRSDDIRWIGQESFHVHRHETGLVTSTPTDINFRPVDDSDADLAWQLGEEVVKILESEHDDPSKGWEDFYDDIVSTASACGIGVGTLDVVDEGSYSCVVPRFLDPRDYMRDPTVRSVHSKRCRFVIFRDAVTREEAIERGFKKSVVNKIAPDGGYVRGQFDLSAKETFAVARTKQGSTDGEETWQNDDEFTIYYVFERKSKVTKTQTKPGTFRELPEESRYQACECGWKSEPQGEDEPLDEYAICPDCGSMATRIDGEEETETVLAFPKGRLSVWAPWSGVDEPLYDGEWQVPCRSYPIFELVRFRHPFEPFGPSLADLNWWNQIFADMMMRLIGERAIQSAPFWVAPIDGLQDAFGRPWRFDTDNGWAMFYEGSSRPQVDLIEGVGIPAAFSNAYQMARAALTSHTGIADLGLEPGQSRNIPASSVAQQVQQQEIPQAHYLRRFQREKARFLGILWDYLRAVDQSPKPVRTRDSQQRDVVRTLRAADFPNFEFYLTTTPDVTEKDKARAEWFKDLLAMSQQFPPQVVEVYAQVNRVPPSIMRRLANALSAAAQAQQPVAPPGAMPEAPSGTLVDDLLSTMSQPAAAGQEMQ